MCSGDESPPMIESVVTWLLENGSEEIDDPRNVETFKDLQSSSENVNENNQTLTSVRKCHLLLLHAIFEFMKVINLI